MSVWNSIISYISFVDIWCLHNESIAFWKLNQSSLHQTSTTFGMLTLKILEEGIIKHMPQALEYNFAAESGGVGRFANLKPGNTKNSVSRHFCQMSL